MKILFFNWRDITNPLGGGAELYVHEIGKRLAKNHEVVLYCAKYRGCSERDEVDGVKIIRRGGAFSVYFYAFFDYLLRLRKENFDIVIDSINCVPFFTPLFTRTPKIALLYHIVNKETISQEIPFPADLVAWLAQRLIPFIYKNINFVTISDSSKEDLVRFGVPRNKVDIVYSGVNHTLLAPMGESEKPLIAYIGVIKRYKQLDHLLRILPLIRREVLGAELVIAGKRGDNELQNMKKNLGLEHCVKLQGEVSEAEKAQILQKAWVFVIPSVKEGWGISVIEANACGTPAIAYDVPGLRDSIKNGKTGLLVPYGNIRELARATIRVLTGTRLRQNLSRNARKWASSFDWDKSAQGFMKIMEKAMGRNHDDHAK